jgi:hypothetical protein
MAKLTLNQLFEVIRGGIGGLVFRRRPDGTIIVSSAPAYSKGKVTPAQKEYRERFKDAVCYARWADDAHPIYEQLAQAGRAEGNWVSAYNFALSDALKAPKVQRIERGEGCIRVQASDNIGVAGVRVTILDKAGTVLDQGEAVHRAGDWWEFASQSRGKTIVAEARDLPDNVTRLTLGESLTQPGEGF